MKRLNGFILVIWLMCSAYGAGVNQEVKWLDWNEGYLKSKQTNKIAVVDCYTDWCTWCKKMDQTTFADDSVKAYLDRYFVPIKFNPEVQKQYITGKDTMTGRQLLMSMSNNKPSGYPTLFFYVPGRNQMFQKAGYLSPDQFLTVLKSIVDYQKSAIKSN